jgi:hypothetical protein
MKKIFLLAMLTVFGISTSNAQESKKVKAPADTKAVTQKLEGAGIVFETETIDYGTIEHNAEGTRKFVFTNNGNKPLIISNTQGSCGCTVPTTPKEPIAPGAKGTIRVKYDTKRPGAINKSVTITSNAINEPNKVIRIKGEVGPAPESGTPVNNSGAPTNN